MHSEVIGRRRLLSLRDLTVLVGIGLVVLVAAGLTDAFGMFVRWMQQYGHFWLFELLVSTGFLLVAACMMLVHRGRELVHTLEEQERIAAQLRARDAKLALVSEQMPSLLWVTDADLRITSAMGADLRLAGLEPERIVGRPLEEAIEVASTSASPAAVHREALAGHGGHYECRIAERDFVVRVEPLRDDGDRLEGCVSLAVDVTERKRAERAVRQIGEEFARRHAEMKRLNDALSTRLAHQTVQQQVMEAVAAALQPAEVAQAFLRALGEALGARVGVLCQAGAGGRIVGELARTTISPEPLPGEVAVSSGAMLRLQQHLERDGLVVIEDLERDERLPADLRAHLAAQHGLRAYVQVGLRAGGDLVGIAYWAFREAPRQFQDEQRALVRNLASSVAAALQNSMRFEQLRQMFFENRAAKLLVDPGTGGIIDANPAACTFYGHSLEDLQRRTLQDLDVRPPEAVATHVTRIVDGHDRDEACIWQHRVASGEVRDVEAYASPVDIQGRRLLYAIIRDVTERRQAEEALRESEERYRSLFENAIEGMFRCTPDGCFTEVNPALVRLLGYPSREEVLALQTPEAFYVDPVEHRAIRDEIERVGRAEGRELRLRRWDGAQLIVQCYARGVHDAAGSLVAYDGLVVDVTERKRAEAALQKSEEKFSRAFRSAPIGISITALEDGRFIDVNDSFVRLLGFERQEDLIGRKALDVGMYPDAESRARLVQRLLRERGRVEMREGQVRTRAGEVRDVIYSADIIEIQGERCLLASVLDVTEHRRMEAEVASLKAFYENTLNELPIQVAVFDREARPLYMNPACRRDEALREGMAGEPAPPAAPGSRPWVEQVIARKEMIQIEETVRPPGGEPRYILRVASPVQGPDGEVVQVVAYGIDLSEQKRFERQLVDAKEQAEQMARLKSSFLANMSHEIRTPLTGIIGFASVLEEELTDEKRELVHLIRQSGQRLLETLNSVLDLARLEAEALDLRLQPLDVVAEVQEAAQLFQPAAAKKGLGFTVTAPAHPVYARMDRACLHRILSNLLSNAIKFTEAGQVGLEVSVVDAQVCINVHDTGVGVGEAFKPHLFEEFKQESTGLARTHQGSGLGLAITKRLVEGMHGQIRVQSQRGVGTTFYMTFPLGAPA